MEALHKFRKGLNAIVAAICIVLFAVMVIVGSYQIITRFVFNNPSTISEELLTYTFAWMAMFATAYVFGKRDHMRMTFVVDKLAAAKRKNPEIFIELLVIAFAVIVLIYAVVPITGILIAIYGLLNLADLCRGYEKPKAEEEK